MTKAHVSIGRVAVLVLAAAAMGCGTLNDGNDPVSTLQEMASTANAPTPAVTLVSAAADLPEGTLVNKPSIIAINGVKLPKPTPSVVTHTESWAMPFPGASYVSSCPECGSVPSWCGGGDTAKAPSSISFVDTFDLPQGFTHASFSMTTTNDDAANIYLNDVRIGRVQTCCEAPPGKFIITLRSDDPSVFRVGKNELRYDLENVNTPCPLSMAYVATVNYKGAEATP
jgi:hypothetical protein